ncbi:ribokinase [Chitinimonas sp.]|uniref:ribokinase n=1 Tax=Chitinimonas sp. TaxID=1934313 RepID=UPI002F95C7FA
MNQPSNKTVCVLGSLNMDLVMRLPRVPDAGETLIGHQFNTYGGGKGANQAMACAKLGGQAAMMGRVGDDDFGRALHGALQEAGVDTQELKLLKTVETGVAMIMVDDAAQNRIVLAQGANLHILPADIDQRADLIGEARLLICQLEIPLETNRRAIALAHTRGVPVLLNPAPAASLPADMLAQVSYLVPNETEASLLTGTTVSDLASAAVAARQLRAMGCRHVLITLGAQGVLIADDKGIRHWPALQVKAVDTTAAGDTFIGGLATGLAEGLTLDEATQLGMCAAAVSVTRPGAQPALPYRQELAPYPHQATWLEQTP